MQSSALGVVLIGLATLILLSTANGFAARFCLMLPSQSLTGLATCAETTPGLVFRSRLAGRMPGTLLPTVPIVNGLSVTVPTAQQLAMFLTNSGLTPSPALMALALQNSTSNSVSLVNGTVVGSNNQTISYSTMPGNFTFNGVFYSRSQSPYANGIPCPLLNHSSLPRPFWGLCGGPYDANVDYWGNSAYCLGVCSFPRFNPYCAKPSITYQHGQVLPSCAKTLPGCFDGYMNQTSCLQSTGASTCVTVHGPNSYPGSNPGQYTGDLWCPTGPPDTDPVICKRNNIVSRECHRNYAEGAIVNGDHLFCLQNTCNPLSQCVCQYVILTEDRKITGQPLKIFQAFVIKKSNIMFPSVAQRSLAPTAYHVWDGPCVTVHVTPSTSTVTTLLKKNDFLKITDHGTNEELCQTEQMRKQSGYITATTTYQGEVIQSSSHYQPGVIKCDKFIDDWEDLLNTDCMTDGQVFGIVALSIVLGVVALVLVVTLIVLFIICVRWSRSKQLAMRNQQEQEGVASRSMLVQDIMRIAQNAGRYIYTPSTVMLMLVIGCGASCTRISKVSGESYICDPECKTYTENLLYYRQVGESFCVNTSPTEMFSLELLSVKGKMNTREMYYTSEWVTMTETHVRCRYVGGCDPSICLGRMSDRTAYNNLVDLDVTTNPGATFCTQVCKGEGVIRDGIDCGCVDVVPNCNYHGYGILPRGHWGLVHELGLIQLTPVFRLTYSNGTESIMEGDIDMGGVKIRVVSDTTIPHNLGSGISAVSGSRPAYFGLSAPAGDPRAGLIGDLQAARLESFVNVNTESFLFDEQILAEVICEAKVCNWVFKRPGLTVSTDDGMGCILPCRKSGYTYSNSSTSSADRLDISVSFNGAPIPISVSVSYIGSNSSSSVDNVCPNIDSDESFTGCLGCDYPMVGTITAKSECVSGPALVHIDGCSDPIPSMIHLTEQFEQYSISCFMGTVSNRVEVCLEGVYRSCTDISSVVIGADILLPNNTRYDITEDGHHDDAQWNPFAVFKNILNGVGDWLDWLLLGLYLVIITAVVLVLVWFAWPLIVSFTKWLRDRQWKYVPAKTEDMEMMASDYDDGTDLAVGEIDPTKGINPLNVIYDE